MSYNNLGPVTIFNLSSMSTNLVSRAVAVKNQDNVGIQLHWEGDAVGIFGVEISSNHLEDAGGDLLSEGDWVELPLDPMITAAGVSDDAYIDLNQVSAHYVRVIYTATSGDSTLDGSVAVAKGI